MWIWLPTSCFQVKFCREQACHSRKKARFQISGSCDAAAMLDTYEKCNSCIQCEWSNLLSWLSKWKVRGNFTQQRYTRIQCVQPVMRLVDSTLLFLGGSGSVSRDLAWGLDSGRFKSSYRPQYGSGLVPLSKALNPPHVCSPGTHGGGVCAYAYVCTCNVQPVMG